MQICSPLPTPQHLMGRGAWWSGMPRAALQVIQRGLQKSWGLQVLILHSPGVHEAFTVSRPLASSALT